MLKVISLFLFLGLVSTAIAAVAKADEKKDNSVKVGTKVEKNEKVNEQNLEKKDEKWYKPETKYCYKDYCYYDYECYYDDCYCSYDKYICGCYSYYKPYKPYKPDKPYKPYKPNKPDKPYKPYYSRISSAHYKSGGYGSKCYKYKYCYKKDCKKCKKCDKKYKCEKKKYKCSGYH